MAFDDDKIKNLFSSKLNNFEANVSAPSMWDEIEQVLSKKDALVIGKKPNTTRKRVVLLVGLVGIAASIITVLVLVLPSEELKVQPVSEQQYLLPPSSEVLSSDKQSASLSGYDTKADKTLAQSSSVPYFGGAKHAVSVDKVAQTTSVGSNAQNTFCPEGKEGNATHVEEEKLAPQKKIQEKDLPDELPYKYPDVQLGAQEEKKKTSSGFALGLKTSMGLLASNETGDSGAGKLFSKEYRSSTFLNAVDDSHKKVKLKHRQPISAGILVSKNLTPRLSVETGIVYTHLSSKVESSEMFEISEEQEFDYLGIPLNLNYTLMTLGKVDFYASLGVMVQKDIHGSYLSQVEVNDFSSSDAVNTIRKSLYISESGRVKEGIHQPHVQVSAHTLLGVSYPLYKLVNVYGTVGGAYYIDAKNKYETIYSDKKTQIDLNLGLKLKF